MSHWLSKEDLIRQKDIALSDASLGAAVQFLCPCYLSAPDFQKPMSCPARIGLTKGLVRHKREATFSYPTTNGQRFQHCCTVVRECMSLASALKDEALTIRTRNGVIYTIGQAQVCQATFAEVGSPPPPPPAAPVPRIFAVGALFQR